MAFTVRILSAAIFLCSIISSHLLASQHDVKVYEVDSIGLPAPFPSLVISDDSSTGDTQIFSADEWGMRELLPDAVITTIQSGKWHIYRVDDFGNNTVFPMAEVELNTAADSAAFYDVNDYGLRGLLPIAVIEYESSDDVFNIHTVDSFGTPSLFPVEIIRVLGTSYSVHPVDEHGVCESHPAHSFEVDSPSSVFGVVFLPAIERTVIDPKHSLIRAVKEHKAYMNNSDYDSDWRSSMPVK